MIQIVLSKETSTDPAIDPLGRTRYGFDPGTDQLTLWDLNRGYYVLGARAAKEKFAVFAFQGVTVLAASVTGIERITVAGVGERGVLQGQVLRPGHAVYDAYVGKQAPNVGVRNPVTYFASPLEDEPCRCGCGKSAEGKDFLAGHDQTALHDRVRKIGTVVEFIEWFDNLAGPFIATSPS